MRDVLCRQCGDSLDYQKPCHTRWCSLCRKCVIAKFFSDNTRCHQDVLRRYIILFALKEEKCVKCGTTNEWNGIVLVLQIHHIDGNRRNNQLDNLEFLCPNCHTQTDNYGFKNRKIAGESAGVQMPAS